MSTSVPALVCLLAQETQPSAQGSARTLPLFYQIMGDVSTGPPLLWSTDFKIMSSRLGSERAYETLSAPFSALARPIFGQVAAKISATDPLAQWVALASRQAWVCPPLPVM